MTIYVDTREKPHAIRGILAEFEHQGMTVIHQKLDEGDYKITPDALFTIDRKQSLGEVCSNLSWEKGRFQRELARAKVKGEKLCVLVENCGEIRTLADVAAWRNPRLKGSPKALNGPQLYKLMLVYAAQYGVEWRFCDAQDTGREIIRLLAEHMEDE